MAYVMLTAVGTPAKAAPTQQLRDLIEDARYGFASPEALHNALLALEAELGLPFTTPTEESEDDE